MKLALVMVFTMVLTSGCAINRDRQADFSRPEPRPTETNPIVTLSAHPSRSPLPATAVFTPAILSATFDALDGSKNRTSVTMKRSPTTRFGATWAEAEDNVRTEFFRIDDDGHVLLTAAIDHDENAISLFDPPLTAVYATLVPGTPHVQEVALRIMDLRNPKRQREAGTAMQTIEHLGRRTILTPHGRFDVDCVSVKFDANLRLARAKRESTLYIMEGVGIIAAEHVETITALGLFSRTNRQTLVRREPLVAAADKSAAPAPIERGASAAVEPVAGTRR